ncbi:hypothetical protein [Bosea caraganae]|nr:hypothetical protein [Bosea caraganae]
MSGIRPRSFAVGIAALAATCIAAPAFSAPLDVGDLQGAWAQESFACDQVYTTGKARTDFKKPRNIFAAAFIVSGSRLTTPGATCKILSITSAGDRKLLSLSCATAIGVDAVKTQISRAQDGSLRRYLNKDDPVGSKYDRCGR